jgi:putative flippase GtrA
MEPMKTLLRCAGSSLATVTVEFGLLSLLVRLEVPYVAAGILAGVIGFFISFVLNRSWAFSAGDGAPVRQMVRHGVVVAGGIGIGNFLMWLQVAFLGLPYQLGWIVGGSLVFLMWTFPMQRWFTYAPVLAPSYP